MSGEQEGSRKALSKEEDETLLYSFRNMNKETFRPWFLDNIGKLQDASYRTRRSAERKWQKLYPEEEMPSIYPLDSEDKEAREAGSGEETKAPAFIHERMDSQPPKIPESQDVIYLNYQEVTLGQAINTLDFMNVPVDNPSGDGYDWWIERCVGTDPQTKKKVVVKIPARRIPIEPDMVIRYLGSVVRDKQAVHTNTITIGGRRWGYTFDRFYVDPRSGKKYDRCCLVLDKVHQAGLMYEKVVGKKSRKAFAVIRRLRGYMNQYTDNPMYEVIGGKNESYMRDLKRLYERHFLHRGDEELAEDIGLSQLLGTA